MILACHSLATLGSLRILLELFNFTERIAFPTSMKHIFLSLSIALFTSVFLLGCSEKTPTEKLEQAVELLQNNETSRALTTLIDLTKNHAEDPATDSARLLLARVYASQGNGPKALETLEKLFKEKSFQDPIGQEAFTGLLQLNAQIGDFEKAIGVIDQVLADDKISTSTVVELKIQRVNYLLSISDDDSKTTEGLTTLRSMMNTGEYASERGAARETLANYYRLTRDYDSSNQVYDDYLQLFPEDPIRLQLLFAKVVNDFAAGKKEEALLAAEKLELEFLAEVELMQSADEKFSHYRILAQNFLALQDFDKMEKYFLAAMGSKPMSLEALRTQFDIAEIFISNSMIHADKDLFQRGINVLEKIIDDNSNSNIAFTAEEQITKANQAFGYRQQQLASLSESDGETSPTVSLTTEESKPAANP